jgi:hypothetical protein
MKAANTSKKRLTLPGRLAFFLGALAITTSAHAGVTIKAGSQGYLTIDYDVQAWYQSRGYTSSTDSADLNNFYLRRDRLIFSGQFNPLIGFFVQTEAPVDGQQGFNNRNIYYQDAYVTIDSTDAMRFIVGKFKIPFTRENLEACLEPLTMDRAEVLAYTPFGASRDTGVAMWGNLGNAKFQYRIMVANGRQGDDVPNSSPRYTVRAHYSLFDPEYGYGYLGTYLGTKKVLTIGAAYDAQQDVAWGNFATKTNAKSYSAYTVDVYYEQPTHSGTYTASAAYMNYDTGDAINSAFPDPNLAINSQLDGYYAKFGYMMPGKVGKGRLQFFLRHERSNYNLSTGFGDQNWNSIGFNYYLNGQQFKLSGEYADIAFDTPNPSDPSQQDYSQMTLGLQMMF